MDAEDGRAAIWEVDRATGAQRVFATRLRNPTGLAFEPQTRRALGRRQRARRNRPRPGAGLSDSVQDGGFYGWPYSYYGQHVDTRVQPQRPDLVAKAIAPDYALARTSRRWAWPSTRRSACRPPIASGAFVGEHGSWDRQPAQWLQGGLRALRERPPERQPMDVVTGFLGADGNARGRPVGVAIDKRGALLVADDVGNTVWRVTGSSAAGELMRKRETVAYRTLRRCRNAPKRVPLAQPGSHVDEPVRSLTPCRDRTAGDPQGRAAARPSRRGRSAGGRW